VRGEGREPREGEGSEEEEEVEEEEGSKRESLERGKSRRTKREARVESDRYILLPAVIVCSTTPGTRPFPAHPAPPVGHVYKQLHLAFFFQKFTNWSFRMKGKANPVQYLTNLQR
jgi:hypothetical protein